VEALRLGRGILIRDQEGGSPVARVSLEVAPGRPLAAIAGDNQDPAGGSRGYRVQGGLQGSGAGPKHAGYVGGRYVTAQVQGGGDDGGALLFGIGGRGRGEDQGVDGLPVPPVQAVLPGRYRHGHTVFVEVGNGPLGGGIPAGSGRAKAVFGNVGPESGDPWQMCFP